MDNTRPATWDDVVSIVRLLQKYDVKFLLVGGYALAAHGYLRTTSDVDFAVFPDPENSKKWIHALSELPDGTTKELVGELDPFDGDYLHAIRINDEVTIDIMPSVGGISFIELLKYSEQLNFEGIEIPVLDLAGLYETKKNSMRPKDQADAELLEIVLREAKE